MTRTSLLLASALCLTFITGTAMAQRRGAGGAPGQMAQGSVSGTIIDGVTGGPLSSATIAIRGSADSALVTGAIAEKDGGFSITGLRPGRYYARISFVGYATRLVDVAITPEAMQLSLGRIVLSADSSSKNEVSVTARRDFMSVAIDRTIYKTDDLLVSSGGSATDVLRNLPQVEVDADGNVSLRGNQNVAVQINGRPTMLRGASLAAFLQGLPANAVERIEVVTNPSAKYDPDGMGGIINIVLNQQTNRGLSGSVTGSAGTTQSYNAGLTLGYGNGPWNLSGSYTFNYGGHDGSGERYRENFLPGLTPVIIQNSTNDNNAPSHAFNANIDYAMGKGGTLSLASVITRRDETGSAMNSTLERDASQVVTERYNRSSENTKNGGGLDNRLGYKLVLEPSRHELSAEFRVASNDGDETIAYTQSNLALDGTPSDSMPARQTVEQTDHSRNYSFQLDYVRPLWEGARLETGYKGEAELTGGEFVSTSYDYGTGSFLPDVALNNSYDYDRITHSFYGTYGQELGDFGAQIGLRLEQANTTFDLKTTGESFKNDYFSAFPSAFLTYKASEALQLKASYSRRIQRPWIRSLNPFVTYDDPQFRRAGNPYLKPEYTDSYEFTASYFADGSSLTLTPFYRRTTDAIRRWETIDSAGVSTMTSLNFDENKSYGVDLIGTTRIGEWLSAFASASAYQTVTDASNVQTDLGSDGFMWMVRGNATFTILTGLDLQVSASYRAPMVIEGGEMNAQTSLDLALSKKILDDRGRLGLRFSDPFKTSGFGMYRRDERYYQTFSHTWDSRGVFLNFSYSFGSQDPAQQSRNRAPQVPSGGDMDMGG